MRCPRCFFKNEEETRKCLNCGFDFEIELTGEKKNVTLFFADIVGYSKLCEELDPEEVKEILDTIFGIIEESVKKHDGYVNKFIGDCILCVFSAPKSTENHPEKAVLSVLDAFEKIKEISSTLPKEVKLHTGIATGDVLVEERKTSFEIIGDTVNIGSRLCSMAGADEILVNETLYKRTKNAFNYEKIGKVKVKGKKKTVEVYRLKGKKEKRGKIRGIEGVYVPLIGRDRELKEMTEFFGEYLKERNKDYVILIKGEPGIGKTRLYEEFKKEKKENLFLEGRALPYRTYPLYPLKLIFQNIEEKYGKDYYKSFFPEGKIGLLDIKPYLRLLNENILEKELKNMTLDELQKKKFYVYEKLLRNFNKKISSIFLFEDIQWADNETFSFLKHLLLSPEKETGLFIIVLSRPSLDNEDCKNFLKLLKDYESSLLIELKPFDFSNTLEFIKNLLDIERLPLDLKSIIFNKSEGNPLFIEEFIKVLIDKGIIFRDKNTFRVSLIVSDIPEIPDTLNDIIMSRVDLLPEDERKILKVSSVIGKTFYSDWVCYLLKRDCKKEIQELVKKEYILKGRNGNKEEYRFRHILIRDIIYDSLLRKQKIIIHLRIAEFLEKLYNEGKYFNEYVIGEHYEKAISYEKAFNFYYKYAQKMDRSNLVHQAISGYEKCINIIEKNNLFKDKKLSIMIRLGPLYSILGKNNKALSILREAYELADERQKGNILYHQAVCYQKASKYAEALNYLSMAEKFSMDNNMKFSLYCEKAWINFLMGNIEEFGNFLNMANSFIEKIRFADGKEKDYKIARVENLFGTYFCEKGKIEEGIKRYKNALSIYEKYKDISGIEVIYNNMGSNLIFIGKIQESIDMILKSREIAKNTGNYLGYAISCNNLGENYVLLNDLKKAENFFKEYLEINKKIRNRLGDGYGNLGLAEIERRRNNFDIAENFYKKSIEILEEVKSKIIKTRAKIMYANFFLKKGNIEKADILIKDSLEYSLLQKHFPGIACCNLLTIEKFLNLLKNNKNYIKNLEELFLKFDTEIKGKLINIFCDIQYLLLKTKFLKTIGDIDKEKKTKDRLNKLMGIILNNIKNPSHREGFLNQPDFYYFIYT